MSGAQFVEYDGAVHMQNPVMSEYTLCSDAFDISAVDHERGEFDPTKSRLVTCAPCVSVIDGCRGVRVALPYERRERRI